jgi:hypothetical protein
MVFIVLFVTLFHTSVFAGTIQLPKTGATVCYDTEGNAISCAGTGQDGNIRSGVTWPIPRFSGNGDQTVRDNLTGLVWAKDGNIIKNRNPEFDADTDYGGARNGAVAWQHALDYIKKLNQENYLGYNDWHLPNINELESLTHAGQTSTAEWLNSQGFMDVENFFYWSSNIFPLGGVTRVTHIDMRTGYVFNPDINAVDYRHTAYVWPVRSSRTAGTVSLPKTGQTTCYNAMGQSIVCAGTGQDGEYQMGVTWPEPRFNDNGAQAIVDNLTGLMWTKYGDTPGPSTCGPAVAKTWQESLDYVKCLNANQFLGYNDWRLPNRKEQRSLPNIGQLPSTTWLSSQGFINIQEEEYWVSNTFPSGTVGNPFYGPNFGMIVRIADGMVDRSNKTNSYYVWPVRNVQSTTTTHKLTVEKPFSGTGNVASAPPGIVCGSVCSANFVPGTIITLTATPDTDSIFTGWSGGGCTETAPCTVTMGTTDMPIYAGFIPSHGNITGQVLADVAGHSNIGVRNATVRLLETSYSTTPDTNGDFSLENIPNGDYTLSISAPGMTTIIQKVSVMGNSITVALPAMTIMVSGTGLDGDANSNGRLGLDDAVYILQILSGTR